MRTGSTGTTNYKSLHCNDSPLSIDPSVSVKARGSKRPEASDRNREATHSIAGTSKYEPTPSFSLRNKASIVATEVATDRFLLNCPRPAANAYLLPVYFSFISWSTQLNITNRIEE